MCHAYMRFSLVSLSMFQTSQRESEIDFSLDFFSVKCGINSFTPFIGAVKTSIRSTKRVKSTEQKANLRVASPPMVLAKWARI